jgi:hypothetical protein
MKLWSRGLGKQQLKMDFMRYEITQDGDEIVISGRITEPVNWDFWIRFDEDDVPGLIRVAKNRKLVRMVLRRYLKKIGRILLFWRRRKPEEAVEPEKPKEPEKAKEPRVVAARPVASVSGSRSSTPRPNWGTYRLSGGGHEDKQNDLPADQ